MKNKILALHAAADELAAAGSAMEIELRRGRPTHAYSCPSGVNGADYPCTCRYVELEHKYISSIKNWQAALTAYKKVRDELAGR